MAQCGTGRPRRTWPVVASPRRGPAFEASRYAIERIKEIVPIWKREVWSDGYVWVGSQAGTVIRTHIRATISSPGHSRGRGASTRAFHVTLPVFVIRNRSVKDCPAATVADTCSSTMRA